MYLLAFKRLAKCIQHTHFFLNPLIILQPVKESPHFRRRKVQYRVHKSLPLISIMKHLTAAHVLPCCFFKNHFNFTLPSMSTYFKRLFSSGFSINVPSAFLLFLCVPHAPPKSTSVISSLQSCLVSGTIHEALHNVRGEVRK